MCTLKQITPQLQLHLKQFPAYEADQLIYMIYEDVLQLSRTKVIAYPDTKVSNSEYNQIMNIVGRLKNNEPVQYIFGYTEFYGLRFMVSPAVLIPRPETEELVHWILNDVKNAELRILDIGTGSGCIPVTLAHHLKQSAIYGLDVSPDALKVALANAKNNKVEVQFITCDILKADSSELPGKLDLLVSNPPYVTNDQKKVMHKNVTDYEPGLALYVSDDDPLVFYRKIAQLGCEILIEGGTLYFEINEIFGSETILMLEDIGYINIELRNDINGKARMIKAQKYGIFESAE